MFTPEQIGAAIGFIAVGDKVEYSPWGSSLYSGTLKGAAIQTRSRLHGLLTHEKSSVFYQVTIRYNPLSLPTFSQEFD